jgi:dihydrofolate synthase/folylpolyglutamate synthase
VEAPVAGRRAGGELTNNMKVFKTNSEAATELLRLPKFGAGVGLHRMLWVVDRMQATDWFTNLDVLKITGSKGKGSASAFSSAILSQLGLRTGLFTSPHLFRFNERIKLNGSDISDEELAVSWAWFKNIIEDYSRLYSDDSFGFFEALTGVAFHLFSRHNVAAVVAEAGIGGRYDSTRPFPGKTVALTSVELEHTELLGETTELIAYDKADLCPSGGTLVVGELHQELVPRLRSYCRLRGIRIVEAQAASEISNVEFLGDIMTFSLKCVDLDFGTVSMPLIGRHQAGNAAVAIIATWDWLSRNYPDIDASSFKGSVIQALGAIHWPGRLQRIMERPEVIIDVGHTPQSMRCVADAIREMNPHRAILLLTGVSRDKNVNAVLAELVPIASLIICTQPHHKGTPAGQVAAICRKLRPDLEVISVNNIEDAVRDAIRFASENNMTVVIAGGLFLAIEATIVSQGGKPTDLMFA